MWAGFVCFRQAEQYSGRVSRVTYWMRLCASFWMFVKHIIGSEKVVNQAMCPKRRHVHDALSPLRNNPEVSYSTLTIIPAALKSSELQKLKFKLNYSYSMILAAGMAYDFFLIGLSWAKIQMKTVYLLPSSICSNQKLFQALGTAIKTYGVAQLYIIALMMILSQTLESSCYDCRPTLDSAAQFHCSFGDLHSMSKEFS